jgi:D-methionine transport system ATP-binding protein
MTQFQPLPGSAGQTAISFQKVTKTYPARASNASVAALSDIDLHVKAGRILGVIGPSGAGKSTLIRLVNGLEQASAGTISLFGQNATRLSETEWRAARRGIGMIFQHFNLLSSRTVYDNVAFPLEIAGADRTTIEKRVPDLLNLVGLTDKAQRYPAELSGGQKQRVGIARALATEPAILLCDEATSALDPETTQSILGLLREINRTLGVTILLITHEIPVIKEICDDVAVIEQGRIIEIGPVFDVFTNPRHPTTARFVQNVSSVEIPAYLKARLRQRPEAGDVALLQVGFTGANATSPVISRLTTTLGSDINIVAGKIDTIGERPFGTLLIALPAETATREAAIAALKKLHLRVHVAGYVDYLGVDVERHVFGEALIRKAEARHVA